MIVITGATGFIGRRVVRLLVKKHDPSSILCLIWRKNNSLETSGRKILSDLHVKTKKIDLVTKYNLKPVTKSPKIVIHLAGITDTYSSDYRCNDIGTKNLLECLEKVSPDTHLVHISTTAIMCGRRDCSKPFDENLKPVPVNRYAVTKLRAEYMVKEFCKAKNIKLTILRYPTVYGKDPRKNSFFDYVGNLVKKRSILTRLNWPGLTSFVHVEDAAKAVLLAMDKPPKSGEWNIFNVSAESFTLQQISKFLHKRIKLPYSPINLPKSLWKVFAWFRPVVYKLEEFLSPTIYNALWRATLLVEDVIYCDVSKMKKMFSQWKPIRLSDKLDDVI